jgi:hypothetical protein
MTIAVTSAQHVSLEMLIMNEPANGHHSTAASVAPSLEAMVA